MFTGIIEETGVVEAIKPDGKGSFAVVARLKPDQWTLLAK